MAEIYNAWRSASMLPVRRRSVFGHSGNFASFAALLLVAAPIDAA
jgi:hypothetical protein